MHSSRQQKAGMFLPWQKKSAGHCRNCRALEGLQSHLTGGTDQNLPLRQRKGRPATYVFALMNVPAAALQGKSELLRLPSAPCDCLGTSVNLAAETGFPNSCGLCKRQAAAAFCQDCDACWHML